MVYPCKYLTSRCPRDITGVQFVLGKASRCPRDIIGVQFVLGKASRCPRDIIGVQFVPGKVPLVEPWTPRH